jgi:hypothetical protein
MRVMARLLAIVVLAGCSGSATPSFVLSSQHSEAAPDLAAKAPLWGTQITADSMGAVGVFQYAICDANVYKSKAPCMHEYNDAPFKMTASMSNHADVN